MLLVLNRGGAFFIKRFGVLESVYAETILVNTGEDINCRREKVRGDAWFSNSYEAYFECDEGNSRFYVDRIK